MRFNKVPEKIPEKVWAVLEQSEALPALDFLDNINWWYNRSLFCMGRIAQTHTMSLDSSAKLTGWKYSEQAIWTRFSLKTCASVKDVTAQVVAQLTQLMFEPVCLLVPLEYP